MAKYAQIKTGAITSLKSSIDYVKDCTEVGDLIDVLDEAKTDLDALLALAYDLDLEEMREAREGLTYTRS